MKTNQKLLIRLQAGDPGHGDGTLALDRYGVKALRQALDMAERTGDDVTLPCPSDDGQMGELTIQHAPGDLCGV